MPVLPLPSTYSTSRTAQPLLDALASARALLVVFAAALVGIATARSKSLASPDVGAADIHVAIDERVSLARASQAPPRRPAAFASATSVVASGAPGTAPREHSFSRSHRSRHAARLWMEPRVERRDSSTACARCAAAPAKRSTHSSSAPALVRARYCRSVESTRRSRPCARLGAHAVDSGLPVADHCRRAAGARSADARVRGGRVRAMFRDRTLVLRSAHSAPCAKLPSARPFSLTSICSRRCIRDALALGARATVNPGVVLICFSAAWRMPLVADAGCCAGFALPDHVVVLGRRARGVRPAARPHRWIGVRGWMDAVSRGADRSDRNRGDGPADRVDVWPSQHHCARVEYRRRPRSGVHSTGALPRARAVTMASRSAVRRRCVRGAACAARQDRVAGGSRSVCIAARRADAARRTVRGIASAAFVRAKASRRMLLDCSSRALRCLCRCGRHSCLWNRTMEFHMLDGGQGDALAVRTREALDHRGRGRRWDVGSRQATVVPYVSAAAATSRRSLSPCAR